MGRELHYNYLRTCRKRLGLSEKEMASLLGDRNGSIISRHEHGVQKPTLACLLAYELIFDLPVQDLFRELTSHAREILTGRSRALLAATPDDRGANRRREALVEIINRCQKTH